MATEEAKIVVTIERGALKSSLKGTEADVAASGRRMKGALSGTLGAGLGGIKKSIKGIFSDIGSHMKTMATFGGAIGAGVLIKDALHLQTLYRNIAYNVSKVPGAAMKWRDVQAVVDKAVERTGTKAEDLAAAFDTVFKETGSLEVAKGALEAIGTMATATGQSTESFAEITRLAFEKFGVSVERLPDAMSAFEGMLGIGGKGVDELSRKFGLMAGVAADAGFRGEEGMKALLSMLKAVDDAVGERPEAALKAMMEALREGGTKGPSEIEKRLGHRFKKGTGLQERMGDVLAAGGKARSAFETKLTGEALAAFNKMAPIFDGAMTKALGEGKNKREAIAIALDTFNSTIYGADQATRSYADNQKEAARRLKEDPALQMQQAMNKLQKVMTSPKALEGIKKLMDVLPPLAENMAKLLSFVIDHPILSGGLALGGRVAAGGLLGAGGQFITNIFKGGGGKGGAGAATVPTVGPPTPAQMTQAGMTMGQKAVSVLAAAGVGYAIGTAISSAIEDVGKEVEKGQLAKGKELSGRGRFQKEIASLDLGTAEGRAKGAELQRQLLAEWAGAQERMKETGIFTDIATFMSGGKTSGEAAVEQKTAIASLLKMLQEKVADVKIAENNKKLAAAADGAAKALDKVGKGDKGGGHGAKPPKKAMPGAAPTAG